MQLYYNNKNELPGMNQLEEEDKNRSSEGITSIKSSSNLFSSFRISSYFLNILYQDKISDSTKLPLISSLLKNHHEPHLQKNIYRILLEGFPAGSLSNKQIKGCIEDTIHKAFPSHDDVDSIIYNLSKTSLREVDAYKDAINNLGLLQRLPNPNTSNNKINNIQILVKNCYYNYIV